MVQGSSQITLETSSYLTQAKGYYQIIISLFPFKFVFIFLSVSERSTMVTWDDTNCCKKTLLNLNWNFLKLSL